jgi:uncharacterized protein YjhX (UPF0386 family)
VLFRVKDQLSLDLLGLLRGECKETGYAQLVAGSCLTGKEVDINDCDLEVLLNIPSEKWVTFRELEKQSPTRISQIHWLARQGLVVTSINRRPFSSLREREEILYESQWNFYSAIYHFMSRWENVFPNNAERSRVTRRNEELSLGERELTAFMEKYGPAPPAFFKAPQSKNRISLSRPTGASEVCNETEDNPLF